MKVKASWYRLGSPNDGIYAAQRKLKTALNIATIITCSSVVPAPGSLPQVQGHPTPGRVALKLAVLCNSWFQ